MSVTNWLVWSAVSTAVTRWSQRTKHYATKSQTKSLKWRRSMVITVKSLKIVFSRWVCGSWGHAAGPGPACYAAVKSSYRGRRWVWGSQRWCWWRWSRWCSRSVSPQAPMRSHEVHPPQLFQHPRRTWWFLCARTATNIGPRAVEWEPEVKWRALDCSLVAGNLKRSPSVLALEPRVKTPNTVNGFVSQDVSFYFR